MKEACSAFGSSYHLIIAKMTYSAKCNSFVMRNLDCFQFVVLYGSNCCCRLCSEITRSLQGAHKNQRGTRACVCLLLYTFHSWNYIVGSAVIAIFRTIKVINDVMWLQKLQHGKGKCCCFFGYLMTSSLTAKCYFNSYEISCMKRMLWPLWRYTHSNPLELLRKTMDIQNIGRCLKTATLSTREALCFGINKI